MRISLKNPCGHVSCPFSVSNITTTRQWRDSPSGTGLPKVRCIGSSSTAVDSKTLMLPRWPLRTGFSTALISHRLPPLRPAPAPASGPIFSSQFSVPHTLANTRLRPTPPLFALRATKGTPSTTVNGRLRPFSHRLPPSAPPHGCSVTRSALSSVPR